MAMMAGMITVPYDEQDDDDDDENDGDDDGDDCAA